MINIEEMATLLPMAFAQIEMMCSFKNGWLLTERMAFWGGEELINANGFFNCYVAIYIRNVHLWLPAFVFCFAVIMRFFFHSFWFLVFWFASLFYVIFEPFYATYMKCAISVQLMQK